MQPGVHFVSDCKRSPRLSHRVLVGASSMIQSFAVAQSLALGIGAFANISAFASSLRTAKCAKVSLGLRTTSEEEHALRRRSLPLGLLGIVRTTLTPLRRRVSGASSCGRAEGRTLAASCERQRVHRPTLAQPQKDLSASCPRQKERLQRRISGSSESREQS